MASSAFISTSFLIQHVSSFAFSLLNLLCHMVFVFFFWFTQNLELQWYGIIGIAMVVVGIRFLSNDAGNVSVSHQNYNQAPRSAEG
jgi:hypothetical protein